MEKTRNSSLFPHALKPEKKIKDHSSSLFLTLKDFDSILNSSKGLNQENIDKCQNLIERLERLSAEKKEYYKHQKFAFIQKFFSSCKNLKHFHSFKSTAYLADEYIAHARIMLNLHKVNAADQPTSVGIPIVISIDLDPSQINTEDSISETDENYDTASEMSGDDSGLEDPLFDASSDLDEFGLIESFFKPNPVEKEKLSTETVVKENYKQRHFEEMLQTFNEIWPNKPEIQAIWFLIFQKAKIKSWKKNLASNTYTLKLKKPLKGVTAEGAEIYVPKNIEIQFSSNGSQNTITFLGKEKISLQNQITFDLDSITVDNDQVFITVSKSLLFTTVKQTLSLSTDEVLSLWGYVRWN